MSKRFFSIMMLVLGALALPAAASSVRVIDWPQLIPKTKKLKDPLSVLTMDQRFDFEMIAWARSLSPAQREVPLNSQGISDAQKFELKFKRAGISVDELLADYRSWQAKVAEQQTRTVAALDGTRVKLAGYLLPLEFSEQGNTEFLLVPYVGACVHVPPPPVNQIVFVRLNQSFVVKDLYTPVWLTGTMRTRRSSKALNLVDGASNVSIGYHLDGDTIEAYEKP